MKRLNIFNLAFFRLTHDDLPKPDYLLLMTLVLEHPELYHKEVLKVSKLSLKFVIMPRKSSVTGKRIWLEKAYLAQNRWLDHWYTPAEFIKISLST